MKRIISVILVLVLAMVLGTGALADGARLSVTGTGVVNAQADTAFVVLGVREVSGDVTTVQAAVNEKINAVIESVIEAGADIKDISTQSMSIYPRYNYDLPDDPIVGYTAENTISIATGDIENAGRFIDAAFEAGVNIFNDIQFSKRDTTAEGEQALALAVQNARHKAEVLAEAAGMKLGAVVSIQENGRTYDNGGALFAKEAAMDAAGTVIHAAQLEVTASVTVEYELAPIE